MTNPDAALSLDDDASTTVSAARAASALDRSFLEIAGAQARLWMNAGHSHEVPICMDARDALNRGGANGNDRVLVQPPADQDDLDARMLSEHRRDARTVRDNRRVQISGQVT